VCTARKPHCPECIIRDLCRYKFKTVERTPSPGKGRRRVDVLPTD